MCKTAQERWGISLLECEFVAYSWSVNNFPLCGKPRILGFFCYPVLVLKMFSS